MVLSRQIAAEPALSDLTASSATTPASSIALPSRILRNPAEAEDVVQDVFVRVLERHTSCPASSTSGHGWCASPGTSRSIAAAESGPSRWTKSSPQAWSPPTLPPTRPSPRPAASQVLDAIERLPENERQALLLSAMDELTTAEIAAILGRSESSVRSLLFRARIHLRERLNE